MNEMIKLPKNQQFTVEQMNRIENEINQNVSSSPHRLMCQAEIPRITVHSLNALVEKKFIEKIIILGVTYYRLLE